MVSRLTVKQHTTSQKIGIRKSGILGKLCSLYKKRNINFDYKEISRFSRGQLLELRHILETNPDNIEEELSKVTRKKQHKKHIFGMKHIVVGNVKSLKQAIVIVHSLSAPSKIPTWCYSISAYRCITGMKLAKVKGTICSECYATGGYYPLTWVQKALGYRLKALSHPDWADAIIFLIRYKGLKYFRWHDSGDLQGMKHLYKIIQIAISTPNVKYWLPTREWGMIRKLWEMEGQRPLREVFPNLCIRLSATKFDKVPPLVLAAKLGVNVSMVSTENFDCPAHSQNDKCLDCRKCWEQEVNCITYRRH